jgi:cell division protein FtsL
MKKESLALPHKSKKLFIGGAILSGIITLAESLAFLEAKYKISGALNKLDDSTKIKDFLKSDWMCLIILASLIATVTLIFAAVLRHKQNILIIQLNTSTQEKDTLQTNLNRLTQEKTDLETKLTQEKNELETRLAQEKTALETKSNADNEKLKKEINEKQISINDLTQELEDKKQEISNGIDESCKKIKELDNKITSLGVQLNQIQNLYTNLSTNSELLLEKVSVLEQEQLRQPLNELITLKTSLESEINNYKKEEEIFEKTSEEKSERNKALEKQPKEQRKASNSSESNKSSDGESTAEKLPKENNRNLFNQLINKLIPIKKTELQLEDESSTSPTNLSRSDSGASNSESTNEESDFIKTAAECIKAVEKTKSEYDEADKITDPLKQINTFKTLEKIITNRIKLTSDSIKQLQTKKQELRNKNLENLKTKQSEFLNKKTDDLYYFKDRKLFSTSVSGSDNDKLNKKEYFQIKQGEEDLASYTKIIENIDNNSFQMNTLDILETINISSDYKLIFNNQKMFLLNNDDDQHFEVSFLSSIKEQSYGASISTPDQMKENFITELLENQKNIGKVFTINYNDQDDAEQTKKFTLTEDMITKVQPSQNLFELNNYLRKNPIQSLQII